MKMLVWKTESVTSWWDISTAGELYLTTRLKITDGFSIVFTEYEDKRVIEVWDEGDGIARILPDHPDFTEGFSVTFFEETLRALKLNKERKNNRDG